MATSSRRSRTPSRAARTPRGGGRRRHRRAERGEPRARGDAAQPARQATPASKRSLRILSSREAFETFDSELRLETARQAEDHASLESVSAVLARLNLFKAYEEEQSSRSVTLGKLKEIHDELASMECPVLGRLTKRHADLTAGTSALAEAAADYRASLDEVLAYHKALDEKRLDFARRAEMLNRRIEEAHDSLSEALNVETPEEADAAEGLLRKFKEEDAQQKVECEALRAFHEEMVAAGARSNPYSRFKVEELAEALSGVEGAINERASRIAQERGRIARNDEKKKQFAAEADKVLAFLKQEGALLDEKAGGGRPVHPDDAESIALGHATLSWFNEYAGASASRAEVLHAAHELSDELMASAELDNPYTHESMASLKAGLNKLEKRVRDVINLVDGQLTRAVVSITTEQQQELKEAFHHFDKSGDGRLNEVEFAAAMRSMDFEDADFAKFADTKGIGADGTQQKCISFDSFLTLVLQQFKDKDTADGLTLAFRALANGKDLLPVSDLDKSLKPADAEYLKARLTASADGGLEFLPFASAVYGGGAPAPVS